MLKKYGITQEMIAKWLGYSTVDAFRNTSKKDKMLLGVEKLIQHVENTVIERIKK
jgi:hypothetical protein